MARRKTGPPRRLPVSRHRQWERQWERDHPHGAGKAKGATRGKATARGGCGGTLELLPETGFCTHGPDSAPPGLDVAQRVQPLSARAAARAAITCDGDGVDGYRVQVLYLRAQNAPDRFSQYLPSIRAWTAGADAIMKGSAADTGGSRRFRFVTNASCQLDVKALALPNSDLATFEASINALKVRGFGKANRVYLAFVDSATFGYCGIGTYWPDDRAGASNPNNAGPAYSRVDAGCWSADIVAHELMHNLGGVQRSAPHSTAGAHCIDEWDVMCYQDASNIVMSIICFLQALDVRYDCNHDDYVHTNPPAGGYLATHWNTANNRFLVGNASGAGNDSTAPTVTITSPRSGSQQKGRKTITVAATASDAGVGVASVEFRRCAGSSCSWESGAKIGADSSAPYETRWKLPKSGTFTHWRAPPTATATPRSPSR